MIYLGPWRPCWNNRCAIFYHGYPMIKKGKMTSSRGWISNPLEIGIWSLNTPVTHCLWVEGNIFIQETFLSYHQVWGVNTMAQQDWSTPDVRCTWFPSRICQENQPITSDPQIFKDLPVAGFGWLWPRIWQTQVASPMLVALLQMARWKSTASHGDGSRPKYSTIFEADEHPVPPMPRCEQKGAKVLTKKNTWSI